jgi:hypothetical protein
MDTSNTDFSQYPARVSRQTAMALLCISSSETFRKVVDATPDLPHKLPGEVRSKYKVSVIARILTSTNPRCATRGGDSKL